MSDTTENALPKAGRPLVEMHAFLAAQRHERYRAFIVHGPPNKGKTTFARKLAAAIGGAYVDVLALVADTPDLASRVDILDAAFIKKLALDAAHQGADVVILDELDFLVPVWGTDLSPLVEIVRKLSVTETQAIIGVVMQTTPTLEALALADSTGQSRILRLDEIQGLK